MNFSTRWWKGAFVGWVSGWSGLVLLTGLLMPLAVQGAEEAQALPASAAAQPAPFDNPQPLAGKDVPGNPAAPVQEPNQPVQPVAEKAPNQPLRGAEKEPNPPQPVAEQEPAQPPLPAKKQSNSPPAAEGQKPVPPSEGPFRKLAPGILRKVEPHLQIDETSSLHDHLGLVVAHPDYTWAKNVRFPHRVWCLEFQYKPVRTIYVDLPQKTGAMQRKLIWYLVYSVTNTGRCLVPQHEPDGSFQVSTEAQPVRFVPEFFLLDRETNKVYPEKIIPLAVAQIRLREDPNRTFYNTAEMMREIPVGQTLWGIATWEDIDPGVDMFSIYIKGLTNALRWEDIPEKYQKGDPSSGRRIWVKTLKLNFWRPTDEVHEAENFCRTGIPPLLERGLPAQPDYEWVYLH